MIGFDGVIRILLGDAAGGSNCCVGAELSSMAGTCGVAGR
jgi:hypothetical protein